MMSAEDVMTELKNKALPVFGTVQERKDRLKKAHGNFYSFNYKVLTQVMVLLIRHPIQNQ